jgi:AraC family transcriptional regulator
MSEAKLPEVAFSPAEIVRRQTACWPGLSAEIVQATRRRHFEYSYLGSRHLLIASERGERRDGESLVEGLPRSTRREFNNKLTLVPAGHRFHGWQEPSALARVTYFHIDPAGPLLDPQLRFAELELAPRLFFEDSHLWSTTAKLKSEIEHGGSNLLYAEALSQVLALELVRLRPGGPTPLQQYRGGLAGRQQRMVLDFLETHLAETVSLAALAEIAGLNPFHFARAFKRTFGLPPHRFHLDQRISRAKSMLARPALSVTEIAIELGFATTSSFSCAFRKIAGVSPTAYRRSLY